MSHSHRHSPLMEVRNSRSRGHETHAQEAMSSPRIYTSEEWLHEHATGDANTHDIDSDASSDSDQSLWNEEVGERSTDVDLSYEGTLQIYRDIRPDLIGRCYCHSEASEDEEDFEGGHDDDDDASWIFVEIESETDGDEIDDVVDEGEDEDEDEDVSRVVADTTPVRDRYYTSRRRLFHGIEGIECLARLFVEYRHHQNSDRRGLLTFTPDWSTIAPSLDESPDALHVREALLNIVARFFADQDGEIVTSYEHRLMREVGISPEQMVRSME